MKQKLLYSLLLVLLLFTVCFPAVASARAGGGGGGTGGGGGGGYGGGGRYYGGGGYYYRHRGTGMASNPGNTLLVASVVGGSIVGIVGLGIGIPYAKSATERKRAKKQMSTFAQADPLWEVDFVRKTVRDSFFEIQRCWSEQDVSIGEAYLSSQLREQFRAKLEWMKMQGKRNVLDQIELKKAEPILVQKGASSAGDAIWMEVQGAMVDYTILDKSGSIPFSVEDGQNTFVAQEKTSEMIEGDLRKRPFTEYWLFVRRENTWVLDEIRQKKERKQLHFPPSF